MTRKYVKVADRVAEKLGLLTPKELWESRLKACTDSYVALVYAQRIYNEACQECDKAYRTMFEGL